MPFVYDLRSIQAGGGIPLLIGNHLPIITNQQNKSNLRYSSETPQAYVAIPFKGFIPFGDQSSGGGSKNRKG